MSAPDLFAAYLSANTAAAHLLQAHALARFDKDASANRRKAAADNLEQVAAILGLELVKADAPADVTMGR